MKRIFFFVIILSALSACQEEVTLPIYGIETVKTETGYDTIYKKVQDFSFIDQKGETITNASFDNHIYIADFFFTSCPSICPVMTKNMLSIHDAYLDDDRVKLLSYSIDPKRDSVQKLDEYANKIDITSNDKWHFVTGEKQTMFDLAKEYMVVAFEDEDIPGGFEHSGYFILVDEDRHIRGYYDGTDEEDVQLLIQDIEILLNEK